MEILVKGDKANLTQYSSTPPPPASEIKSNDSVAAELTFQSSCSHSQSLDERLSLFQKGFPPKTPPKPVVKGLPRTPPGKPVRTRI